MGGFLAGKSGRTNARTPVATTLRIQTAVEGRPIAIGAGQNRFSGNVIWYGGFRAVKVKNPGGKGGGGGGKGGKSFNYFASFLISLSEGPIAAFQTIFNGNAIDFLATPPAAVLAELAAIGVVPTYGNIYAATFLLGDYAQDPWSYLAASFPTQSLAYRGRSAVGFNNFALGSSPTVPSFGFEVLWSLNTSAGSPTVDVNPADWIAAFLTNPDWGVPGFPSTLLGPLTAYTTFCRAYGIWISPAVTDQIAAQSHLQDLMTATASDFLWSQGLLSIVPYAEKAVTGNAVTFTPSVTPIYDIADFLPGSGGSSAEATPISQARKNPREIVNQVKVEFLNRGNLYNSVTVPYSDDAAAVSSGRLRPSDSRTQHFFCTRDSVIASLPLQLARETLRAQYQFTLPPQYVLLDPFDIVTLTDPVFGFVKKPVRIIEIQENSDSSLSFTAEDYLGTVGPAQFTFQASGGAAVNSNVDPGTTNAPIIFEPPSTLATNEIWMAVSGASPTIWGGCNVWISTDGGANYTQASGQVSAPAKQGVSTAALPSVTRAVSGPTVDNTNTLNVNLTQSQGALASVTAAEMNALLSLSYIGGELISYQTATLTSAYNYGLAPMVRGAYGSPITLHSTGAQFALLDSNIFVYPYKAGLIGSTIYIKFQGFNIYGGGQQSLAALTPSIYTVAGTTPLRVDHYNAIALPAGGATTIFQPDGGTTPLAFSGGPNGAALPYVSVTWTVTAGDVLVITALTKSSVNVQITNAGAGVARTVNIVAQGY